MRALLLVLLAAGALAAGPAKARHFAAAHAHAHAHHHFRTLPYGYGSQGLVQPQFNNPGPPVAIPQPGNPVEQLAPLESTNPGFWSH